jgi:hypothetical protein
VIRRRPPDRTKDEAPALSPAEAPVQSKTSRVILTPAERIGKRLADVLARLALIGIQVIETEPQVYRLRRSDGRHLALIFGTAELCRRGRQFIDAHAEAVEVLGRGGAR